MTFIAFGIHVINHLLKSPYFTLAKLLIREEHKDKKKLFKLLNEKKIPYQIIDKIKFSRYHINKQHQGLVAFIHRYYYTDLEVLIKKRSNNKFSIIVMLDSIEDPQNFGSILRSTAAQNIDGIIISERNQAPVNNTTIKVSAGGIAHIPVCRVSNLNTAIQELKKNDYQIIATVCQPKAQPYYQIKITSSVCLIFGNEHQGIKPNLIKKSDICIYIPVKNEMNSFNVSTSCSIICAQLLLKIN